ncbi:MAG TPA: DUF4864 domain-containing protein [Devosia sp.]|jgi:hypothetical protein|uniref:DUF4864 domain-containing protein n=1 Tax=Devosia sp. TaxID=1871048 RepID=UPI002DDD4A74|nr:DUF4864 domain-containing protein [Devosia sp.]HEV2514610.1 DUF4864 domain-containing protein [Devosia sp.]
MGSFATTLKLLLAVVLTAFLMVGPGARAQDQPAEAVAPEPWQSVIDSQIEAFRTKDAPAAFSYAGAGFQVSFPSAEAFFNAIVTAGYAPIMESRSHSFGRFQKLGDKAVAQEVKFVGNDQSLYEAIYMLAEEANGWRVQGVQLAKQAGMGI